MRIIFNFSVKTRYCPIYFYLQVSGKKAMQMVQKVLNSIFGKKT